MHLRMPLLFMSDLKTHSIKINNILKTYCVVNGNKLIMYCNSKTPAKWSLLYYRRYGKCEQVIY
jgi:hypothetical protein